MSAPLTPAWSNERRASTTATDFTNPSPLQNFNTAFDNTVKPEEFENSLFGDMNFQQPTPASSILSLSSQEPTSQEPGTLSVTRRGLQMLLSQPGQSLGEIPDEGRSEEVKHWIKQQN